MQRCLQTAGRRVSDDDVVWAWTEYSHGIYAGWLMLPEDDPALLEILLKYLPSGADTGLTQWRTTITDAGDGSGNGMMELPDELLAKLSWKEGDTLTIAQDKFGDVIIRRTE